MKIAFIVLSLLFPVLTWSQTGFRHPVTAVKDSMVILPPAWAFGILYGSYGNQKQSEKLVSEIISREYPIDGFWIDSWFWDWKNKGKGPTHYLDFTGDTLSYPDLFGFWTDFLGKNHIKAGFWIWDCIQETGNEPVYSEFKSAGLFSDEFIHTSSWHNGSQTTIIGDAGTPVKGTRTGNIDFDNPLAVRKVREKVLPFFLKGADFLKLDKSDAIPFCREMSRITSDFGLETRGRGFILSHSGSTETGEYKKFPGKWTDDTRSDWAMKTSVRHFSSWLPPVAFRENVEMYTNPALPFHQIPFLANDLGGFAISTDGFIDEELYIRWAQFALLLPITTVFSQPENPTGNIPFNISERAGSVFFKYARLKSKLFPYLYSTAHHHRLHGVPSVRPVPGYLHQYLLGDQLLIAPVVEQGSVTKTVFLPGGSDWYDLTTGNRMMGGREISVQAPLDILPAFIKAGSILPMRKPSRAVELGTNDSLEFHIYSGETSSFQLIEDDGTSNDYLKGIYAETILSMETTSFGNRIIISPVKGSFQRMPDHRYYRLHFYGFPAQSQWTVNGNSISLTEGNNYRQTGWMTMSRADTVVFEIRK